MVIVLLFPVVALGQDIAINSYKNYDTRSGLVSINVRKVLKDKYGFIWCATQEGLSRYDGKIFNSFSSNTNDNRFLLNGVDVFDMVVDENNDFLWALTTYGGINKISIKDLKVVSRHNLRNDATLKRNFWFKSIIQYNKHLYIGTDEGELIKYNPATNLVEKSWQPFKENNSAYPIDKLLVVENKLWLFCSNLGIILLDADLNLNARIESSRISANPRFYFYKAAEKDNFVWIATDRGLVVLEKKTHLPVPFSSLKLPALLQTTSVRCIGFYNKGVYVSGEAGLFDFNTTTRTYTEILFSKNFENKNWFGLSNDILAEDNLLWIATQYGILSTSQSNPFVTYSVSLNNNQQKIQHSMTLLNIGDSVVYACADDGLYKTDLGTGRIDKVISNDIVYSIFKTDNGLIASGGKGLTLIGSNGSKRNIAKEYPELDKLKNDPVITNASYRDSLYFMASLFGNGVWVWDKKLRTVCNLETKTGSKICSQAVNRLYIDAKKRLWILNDNCFTIYNIETNTLTNREIINTVTGKPVSINMDICETSHSYWIAAYGTGIAEISKNDSSFRLKRIIGPGIKISSLGLYKIFQVGDSILFISTNNGLFKYKPANNQVKSYFEFDGLNTNNFEETSGDFSDNFLYFGGLNGFSKIKLAAFQENTRPPLLVFTHFDLKLNSGAYLDSYSNNFSKIIVPNNALQTIIHFSGINYFNPDRTIFQYRIVNQSNEWIDLGSQNFITLIGLSPGTYYLQVKAANEDGVWSEPKELILVFLPKWYQTWWFYTLVVLAVAGILYALYRYRISQIKKQHEIRKNIATDLHDDLGSTLNSVKVFTNLAISGVNQNESLQQVKDNLTEATISLRDMIWVLDDSLDTVDELVTRLKQFALPITAASNMEFVINANSDVNSRVLTKEEKRNLFLICKEAINNSIKYSGASQIKVDIIPAGKKIKITVADNGKGFDEATIKKGYGLKNMQYRAGQVGYNVQINTIQNRGTQIFITAL